MAKNERRAAEILGAFFAADVGVKMGQQQAREQAMVEQERQRRARLQEQDQQFQMFSALSGAEADQQQRARADENALLPYLDDPSRQSVLQARATPQGMPARDQFLGWLQRQTGGGGATMGQPMPSQSVPGFAPTATKTAPVQPQRTFRNLNEEAELAALAGDLEDNAKRVFDTDPALSGRLSELRRAVVGKKMNLASAQKASQELLAGATSRFQQQSRVQEDRNKALEAQAAATLDVRKAELESIKANREAMAAGRERDDVRQEASALYTPYADALKSGNVDRILKAGGRYAGFLAANRQHFPGSEEDDLDPTPRQVRRQAPDPKATTEQKWEAAERGAPLPMVEVIEVETPAQVEVRRLAAAKREAGTPKAQADLTKAMLPRLWSTVMNPKVSDESRAEAFEVVSALAKENPSLEGLFPASLPKLERVSPELKHRIDREAILDRRYKEERTEKRKRFEMAMEKDRVGLQKTREEIARNRTRFTDSQKQAFKALGDDLDSALKELSALDKIPEYYRGPDHAEKVAAAQAARDEAKAALTQGVVTGQAVEQLIPSKRGPTNELGFNPFQMKAIKALQQKTNPQTGARLSFEEAANIVRRGP